MNEHTCSVILQACSEAEDLIRGEQIHGFVIKSGIEDNVLWLLFDLYVFKE